jgi:hypothetical protein
LLRVRTAAPNKIHMDLPKTSRAEDRMSEAAIASKAKPKFVGALENSYSSAVILNSIIWFDCGLLLEPTFSP